MIRDTVVYKGLKLAKRKARNYLADQGILNRRYHHFFAKYDPLVKANIRKKIYQSLVPSVSPNLKAIVDELEQKGYAFLNFSDLGIDDQAVLAYCTELMQTFTERAATSSDYLHSLEQGIYAGKTISYRIYQKEQTLDPLASLALHENLIKIATLYIKYLPLIEETSMVYNPVHTEQQFGSQLWHCDSQQQRILKLFFSPMHITRDNGPFEFYPPSLSTTRFYQNLPEGMTDAQIEAAGLDLNCAIPFLATPSQCMLVDTVRCLHRGGMTRKPRFTSTISYSSPLYSFTPKKYRQTGTYRFSFETYQKENQQLLKQYESLL